MEPTKKPTLAQSLPVPKSQNVEQFDEKIEIVPKQEQASPTVKLIDQIDEKEDQTVIQPKQLAIKFDPPKIAVIYENLGSDNGTMKEAIHEINIQTK